MRATLLALCTVLLGANPEPPRVAAARARVGPRVQQALESSGVPRPQALLLRVFKEERVLEVWASTNPRGPFAHVADHRVCSSSGGPGPKARKGDGQVPEGLYRVASFNPWSQFHLSMRLDYPNAADRARNPGVPASELGGDIFVHGNCVTIGCIPIGDDAIEEVYLTAIDVRARGGPIAALLLPARPGSKTWNALVRTASPANVVLWHSLKVISEGLDATHHLLSGTARPDGSYTTE